VRGLAVWLAAFKATVDARGRGGSCHCISVSSRTETLREFMLKKTWGSASLSINFKRD
jgi:hypothetical protein